MNTNWFEETLTGVCGRIIGDRFLFLKSDSCIFFSILKFEFLLYLEVLMEGLQKAESQNLSVERAGLKLLSGALPLANLKMEVGS